MKLAWKLAWKLAAVALAALLAAAPPASAAHRQHAHKHARTHVRSKPTLPQTPRVWDAGAPADAERMLTPFPSTFSTINPTLPVTGSSLSSAPIRANFAAAYSDINNLYTQLSTPLNFLTAGTGIAISATGTVSFATIPANTLWANPTGSPAVPAASTLSSYLDSVLSPAAGAVLYRGGSNWQAGVLSAASGGSTAFAPSAASGGSANAQTFAAGNPSSWALLPGNSVCGVMTYANTSTATLSVNGTVATAIKRRSTSGLIALAGGEIIAGQEACFTYDGTAWEIMSAIPAASETQAANYVANLTDGNGDIYNFTGAGPTLTLPQSTTVNTAWHISVFALGGPVTLTPNAADKINGGTTGATVTIPQYAYTVITTDGAGNYYAGGLTVTNAQLATMPASTLKGNATTGVAAAADLTIAQVQALEGVFSPPQGRLTLTSATPVLTATVSGATTVYYTPYIGTMVPIYNGSTVQMYSAGELSQATTDATKSPAAVAASSCYDVFVWSDAGTLRATRGPVWTNTTTRSQALAKLNTSAGQWLLVNGAAITNGPGQYLGTFVGTICSNAGSTIDYIFGGAASGGTAASFNVWNQYNRVNVSGTVTDNGVTYTYTTSAWRENRASTTFSCRFIVGAVEDETWASHTHYIVTGSTSGNYGMLGVGLNSTSATTGPGVVLQNGAAAAFSMSGTAIGSSLPQFGLNTWAGLEDSPFGTNTFGVLNSQYPTLSCHMRM